MELKNFVKIYDDVLPLESVSRFIRFINLQKEFEEACVGGDAVINTNIRKADVYELGFTNNKSMTNVHWCRLLSNMFLRLINQYQRDLNLNDFPIHSLTNVTVLRYQNSGFYTWHTDHFFKNPRTISCIFLLNNDYEGGNLCFRNPDGSGEWEVEVKANRVILWPSNFLYPHTVKPLTKGKRYSVVSWAL